MYLFSKPTAYCDGGFLAYAPIGGGSVPDPIIHFPSSSDAPPISPNYHAGWTDIASAVRILGTFYSYAATPIAAVATLTGVAPASGSAVSYLLAAQVVIPLKGTAALSRQTGEMVIIPIVYFKRLAPLGVSSAVIPVGVLRICSESGHYYPFGEICGQSSSSAFVTRNAHEIDDSIVGSVVQVHFGSAQAASIIYDDSMCLVYEVGIALGSGSGAVSVSAEVSLGDPTEALAEHLGTTGSAGAAAGYYRAQPFIL